MTVTGRSEPPEIGPAGSNGLLSPKIGHDTGVLAAAPPDNRGTRVDTDHAILCEIADIRLGGRSSTRHRHVGFRVRSWRRPLRKCSPPYKAARDGVLGVATAAGIFELSIGTALRKLAEAKLGLEKISEHVHRFDRSSEMVISNAFVWAEPVSNYFWRSRNGEWMLLHDLPCEVPKDWQGGFVVYGHTDSGALATFSRTLPPELESLPEPEGSPTTEQSQGANLAPPTVTQAPNHVVCECGAIVAAGDRKTALKALAEHKR